MDRAQESGLRRVLDHFAAEHAAQARAKEQIASLTVQVSSRDGAVEVTVAALGDVSALSFPGEKYRQLPARTLADSLLEALTTARAELVRRTAAIVESLGLLPSDLLDIIEGTATPAARLPSAPDPYWRRFVGEARAVVSAAPAMADAVEAGRLEEDAPHARGPLWGSERQHPQCVCRHAPVPVELRRAVLALGDSVRGAVTASPGPGWTPGRTPGW